MAKPKEEAEEGEFMSDRFYSFKCITYLSEESLLKIIASRKDISHWCYILHDKDITEKGEPKEEHRHLLVSFKQQKSFKSVQTIFSDGENGTRCQPIEDLEHDVRYLTHQDDPEKYQYRAEDIVTDGTSYWTRITKGEIANDSIETFIDDLCNPEISMKQMAIRYGKDYMKNWQVYQRFAEIMLRDEAIRGNIEVADVREVNVLDLKLRYTNPDLIEERDDTVYDFEAWRRK